MSAHPTAPAPAHSAWWLELLDDLRGVDVFAGPGLPIGTTAALTAAGARVGRPRVNADLALVAPSGGAAREALREAASRVTDGGRVAVLAHNKWYRGAVPRRRLMHWLTAEGLHVETCFGLLRDPAAPVVAFDLAAPAVVAAVLTATSPHIGGVRGVTVRALRAANRIVGIGALLPGWLIIARRGDPTQIEHPISGMIGHRNSVEIKLVRGPGPDVLDKRYLTEAAAHADAAAMARLDAVGLTIAPRLVARPSPTSVWMQWRGGAPLPVPGLRRRERIAWNARAGQVLDEIQRTTRDPDSGDVLVHGDFWLGNLLVDGDRIVAVVDWAYARVGPPDVDRANMVFNTLSRRKRRRLSQH